MNKEYSVEPQKTELKELGMEFLEQKFNKAGNTANSHIHSAVEFIYVVKGEYRVFANEAEFLMKDGDMCLFRSNTIHRISALSRDGGSYYVFKIDPTVILTLTGAEDGIAYLMYFVLYKDGMKLLWSKEEIEMLEIKEIFDSTVAEYESDFLGKKLSMKINAVRLLLAVLRSDKLFGSESDIFFSDEYLTRQIYSSIVFINRNFDKAISAEECAKHANMSYSWFSRSFKKITGNSFKEYLNHTRINRAEKMLLSTDKSVTDICFSCGYNNVSYFIAQYKKLRGKTPYSFRNGI